MADRDDELLALVGRLTTDGEYVDTERLARAVYDADREAGRPAFLYPNDGPWYGLSAELRALEDRGWIDVDPGMAEVVPPGAPTPVARHFYIGLTAEGRARLSDRN